MNANELARPFCWQYKSLPFRGLLFEPQLRPGSKDRLRCGLMLLVSVFQGGDHETVQSQKQ